MVDEKDKKETASDTDPHIDPKPAPDELGVEYGVEQNLPFVTPFYSQNEQKRLEDKQLNELLRGDFEDEGPTIPQLIAMRRMDGQARALYRLLTLPIKSALSKSTFVPAEGGEEEAEFIDNVFNLPQEQGGMEETFSYFMSQLLQGLFDGFSPFEQVYWQPSFGPLAGKYTLQKLAYRPSDTITFVVDDRGGFEGFRQRASVAGRVIDVYIPRDRAFYYAAQEEERKFYGVSFFQSAFYHYDKKVKIYYLAHLAAQRAAVGMKVGTYPRSDAGTTQKTQFNNALANLGLANWLSAPEGYKVDLLKSDGSFPFLEYINHHNSQMSKSILAQFFDKEQGGSSEGKLVSFGQPGDEMFMLMLRAIMDDIAAAINHHIIPRLIDWNFSGAKYPKFQWAALSDDQKASIYTTFDKLATVATTSQGVTPEFMRELEKKMAEEMGLEIDYEEIEREEEEERAKLEEQQELITNQAAGLPVTPEDQAISDFESAAGGGAAPAAPAIPEEEQKPVKLTSQEDLVVMAEALMKDAAVALASAQRRVKTKEGADRYNSPIGTVIGGGSSNPDEDGRPITVERLLSLQRQLDAAEKQGNDGLITDVRKLLNDAVKEYAEDDPAKARAVLNALANPNKSE